MSEFAGWDLGTPENFLLRCLSCEQLVSTLVSLRQHYFYALCDGVGCGCWKREIMRRLSPGSSFTLYAAGNEGNRAKLLEVDLIFLGFHVDFVSTTGQESSLGATKLSRRWGW